MKSATVVVAVAAAALLGSALAAPATAAPATAAPARAAVDTTTVPAACQAATFDTAEVLSDAATRTLTLVVRGMKSATNVTIELVPVVYIRQPEYWAIQVIGCSSGIGLPVLTPYTAKLDVTHTVGTIGIVVVGANGSLKIPVRSA